MWITKQNQYTNFSVTEAFASSGESFKVSKLDADLAKLGYFYSGSSEWISSNSKFNFIRGESSPFVSYIEEDLANINVDEDDKVVVNILSDMHWVCMQELSETSKYVKGGSLLSVTEEQIIYPANGLFVLEGTISANDAGSPLSLGKFDYMKPRTYEYSVSGNGKAFLIQTI